MTPQAVELAFEYLLPLQTDGEYAFSSVFEQARDANELPGHLLLRLAEDIVFPVTAVAPEPPSTDPAWTRPWTASWSRRTSTLARRKARRG
jgi:hypothetical protein